MANLTKKMWANGRSKRDSYSLPHGIMQGDGPGSAGPGPRVEEDGEATGIELLTPKPLCSPLPPKCNARGLLQGWVP